MKSKIISCNFCNSGDLTQVLHILALPLLRGQECENSNESSIPSEDTLNIYVCNVCNLIQQENARDKLFSERDGKSPVHISNSLRTYDEELAEHVWPITPRKHVWQDHSLLLIDDNGSNLLQSLLKRNEDVMNIIPTNNPTRYDRDNTLLNVHDFTHQGGLNFITKYQNKRFNLVIRNFIQYLPDLRGFVEWLRVVLSNIGYALIEVPYIRDATYNNSIDIISREQLYYFSLSALCNIFHRHSLRMHNAIRRPINGGTLQLRITHAVNDPGENRMSSSVCNILDEEESIGIDKLSDFASLVSSFDSVKQQFLDILNELQDNGSKIVIYGADKRSKYLMQYLNITLFNYVIDDIMKDKQGVMSKMDVYHYSKLNSELPDIIIILKWYNTFEIIAKLQAIVKNNIRILVPLPQPEVMELFPKH